MEPRIKIVSLRKQAWIAFLAALALIALPALADNLSAFSAGSGGSDIGSFFDLTTRTTDKISGIFNDEHTHVQFESHMKNTSQISLRVSIDDLVLDAFADLEQNIRILDGHGNSLSVEDKEALMLLSKKLEQYLEPFKKDIPAHESFLGRVILYWAEAPVGFPLTRREIQAPTKP